MMRTVGKESEKMASLNRKDFIRGAAAAAGMLATSGCRTFGTAEGFYGPTIRDRLWMWGHHKDGYKHAGYRGSACPWPGPTVEQAEGCRLMGIPNDCVIRWLNKPAYPWGDYFEQFRSLKRFTFGITDGGNGTIWDKLRIATEELKPQFPNFTGCFLDDYFNSKVLRQNAETLRKVSAKLHENDLRLSVVLYSDQDGFKDEFKEELSLCDETSLWFWKSGNIGTMADRVKCCRDFIGPDKDLLLGLYMWDFDLGKPVPEDRMVQQLEFARTFLADGTVTGLIFHPTFAAKLDVPAVRLAKEWITAHGEDRWGV